MALDRAIDAFVMAASSPRSWPDALQAVAESLGADGATLMHGASRPAETLASRAIREIVDEYFKVGAQIDTREQRVVPGTHDDFLGDFDNFSADEIARDPFYAEFLRPRGFGWHATAALSDGSETIFLGLKRRWSRGPFQRHELRHISRALPHIRAATHYARISLDARSDDHLANLASAGQAGLLLDAQGAAIRWNERMTFGDGLALRGRRLATSAATDQAALDRAIDIALSPGLPSDLPVLAACTVRRPSGRRPLIVRVARLFPGHPNPVAEARAVVLIVDPELKRPSSPQLLRGVFGLTPREADIAALLGDGLSLTEVAQRCLISLPHARQRVKVILQKTGTTRQGELIALLSRLR